MDLMSVAHDNDIELEGACGGELACSTCHLIFDADIYESLPEKDDEEDDMLDLAFEVTDTSRLGCQIHIQESFDGMTANKRCCTYYRVGLIRVIKVLLLNSSSIKGELKSKM